jgi:hypothetical protein
MMKMTMMTLFKLYNKKRLSQKGQPFSFACVQVGRQRLTFITFETKRLQKYTSIQFVVEAYLPS